MVAQRTVQPGWLGSGIGRKRLHHAKITQAVDDRFALVNLDGLQEMGMVAHEWKAPSRDATPQGRNVVHHHPQIALVCLSYEAEIYRLRGDLLDIKPYC